MSDPAQNVVFDRIVLVPPLPIELDGLFFPYYGSRRSPDWKESRRWVSKGESVCRFHAQWTFGTFDTGVPSPVNGYLLAPREYGYGLERAWSVPRNPGPADCACGILLPEGEVLEESSSAVFAALADAIHQHQKKLFADRYLNESLRAWPSTGELDSFLRAIRASTATELNITNVWPSIAREGVVSVSEAAHIAGEVEKVMQERPSCFTPQVHQRRRDWLAESFEICFHPELGGMPDADLRRRIYTAYRPHVANGLGPRAFHSALAGDARFSPAERGQILWFGVAFEREIEAFRDGKRASRA